MSSKCCRDSRCFSSARLRSVMSSRVSTAPMTSPSTPPMQVRADNLRRLDPCHYFQRLVPVNNSMVPADDELGSRGTVNNGLELLFVVQQRLLSLFAPCDVPDLF